MYVIDTHTPSHPHTSHLGVSPVSVQQFDDGPDVSLGDDVEDFGRVREQTLDHIQHVVCVGGG